MNILIDIIMYNHFLSLLTVTYRVFQLNGII